MSTSRATSRTLAVTNAVVTVGVVGWNGWAGARGLAGNTVGSLSDAYHTRFTPAGYAFSIWGLIFTGLLVHTGYQLWLAFRRDDGATGELAAHRASFFARLGPWLILTNLANALWLVLWLTEQTLASAVVLAAMFGFLTVAMVRLDMETWDAPFEIIALVWWPIVIYAGWVTVAVLANVSALLAKHGWVSSDSELWALAMIGVATVYNVGLVVRRNLREHAAVAIWALVAIAVAQWGRSATVQWAAVTGAAVLSLVAGAHAFRNRRTLPGLRRLFSSERALRGPESS